MASPSLSERDKAFEHLQEVFKGKVDADVIYLVFMESKWQVNETFDKLLLLVNDLHTQTQREPPGATTLTKSHSRGSPSPNLSLTLHSRLPSSSNEQSKLPMLSPKTPHVAPDYPQFNRAVSLTTTTNMKSAMAALDSYSMNDPPLYSTGFFPPHDVALPAPSYSQSLATDSVGFSGVREGGSNPFFREVAAEESEAVWPGYTGNPTDRECPLVVTPTPTVTSGEVTSSQKKRVFRKKAYSLNPEEREALEDLIQNVIIDGVDDEAMDSDDSDTQEESEGRGWGESGGEEGGDDGDGKVYPPQLKVAVKHMKNLPPRFLKKIHVSPRPVDINLPPTPEVDVDDGSVPRRGIKKAIRNLMDGLDAYIDDGVELVEEASPGPGAGPVECDAWPTPRASGPSGAVSCADLEREMLANAGSQRHHQGATTADEKSSRFSINAPEFVPRAFTPSSSPNSLLREAPPGGVERNSPVPPAMRMPPPPPTFLIPKVSAYPGLGSTPLAHHHPGVVLGLPYQQYPTAIQTPFIGAPLRAPFRAAPSYAVDKGRLGGGLQYPCVPLYVSPPQGAVLPPPLVPVTTARWAAPIVAYMASPQSSPKAMRRVIQPYLVPAMPLAPSRPPGGVLPFRCSPQSSPKARRRPAPDSALAAARHRVITAVTAGTKILVMMRGCAGSGKTTLAKEIEGGGVILTTDDFFKKDGLYNYNKSKLAEAHEWNRKRAKEALDAGTSPVIIDNTNSQSWEMKYYVLQALKSDYQVELLEPGTSWRYNAKELAARNTHSVSPDHIQRMLDRFEYHVTIDDIIRSAPAPGDDEEAGGRADDGQEGTTPGRRSSRRRRRKRGKRRGRGPLDGGDTSNDGDRADGDVSSDDEAASPPLLRRAASHDDADRCVTRRDDTQGGTEVPPGGGVTERGDAATQPPEGVCVEGGCVEGASPQTPLPASHTLHNGHVRPPGGATLDGLQQTSQTDAGRGDGEGQTNGGMDSSGKMGGGCDPTLEGKSMRVSRNGLMRLVTPLALTSTPHGGATLSTVLPPAGQAELLLRSSSGEEGDCLRPAQLMQCGSDANCVSDTLDGRRNSDDKPTLLAEPAELTSPGRGVTAPGRGSEDIQAEGRALGPSRTRQDETGSQSGESGGERWSAGGGGRKSSAELAVELCRQRLALCRTVSLVVSGQDGRRLSTTRGSHATSTSPLHADQLDLWSPLDDDCPWTTLTTTSSAPTTPPPQPSATPLTHAPTAPTLASVLDDLQLAGGAPEWRDEQTSTRGGSEGGREVVSQARDITSDLSDRATPPRHPRSTPHFDKGCSVSPGERWGGGGAGAVAVLAVHFPMLSADDLSHIIDTCGGDIDWAANVLLDAGYGEEGREGREGREGPTGGAGEAEEHTNMGLVMDALLETGLGEEAGLEEAGLEEAGLGEEAGLEEAGLEEAELREAGRAVESAAPVGGLSGCEECGACPPLLCLSHSALQSAQRVVTTELREALVANSLLRLRSVESFHSRRRRVESTDSTLTLHLPTALITQLTAMFGRGRTQPADGAQIRLDVVTAHHLHRCWLNSAAPHARSPGGDTEHDEFLARILQEDEELACLSPASSHPRDVADTVPRLGRQRAPAGESLQEIMDEEVAMERSRHEHTRLLESQRDSLSTRLKRQKLEAMFPQLDGAVLDDVYGANGYSLEATLRCLQQMYGAAPSSVPDESSVSSRSVDWQPLTMSASEVAMFDYDAVREEAMLHSQLRRECFVKAESARRSRRPQVAAFYAQQARLHNEKMRQAEKIAVQKVIAYRSVTRSLPDNYVDLHGLTVLEALAAVRYALAFWELDLQRPMVQRKSHLYVLTGKGHHSRGGVARIRPAVISYLRQHAYSFTQLDEGTVKVQLTYNRPSRSN